MNLLPIIFTLSSNQLQVKEGEKKAGKGEMSETEPEEAFENFQTYFQEFPKIFPKISKDISKEVVENLQMDNKHNA